MDKEKEKEKEKEKGWKEGGCWWPSRGWSCSAPARHPRYPHHTRDYALVAAIGIPQYCVSTWRGLGLGIGSGIGSSTDSGIGTDSSTDSGTGIGTGSGTG